MKQVKRVFKSANEGKLNGGSNAGAVSVVFSSLRRLLPLPPLLLLLDPLHKRQSHSVHAKFSSDGCFFGIEHKSVSSDQKLDSLTR